MRVSRLYKKEDVVETDAIPMARLLLWAVVALVVVIGVVLYFRYQHTMTPLL